MSNTLVYIVFSVIMLLAIILLAGAAAAHRIEFFSVFILALGVILYLSCKPIHSAIQNHSLELKAKVLAIETKKNQTWALVLFSQDAEAAKFIFDAENVKRTLKADYDAEYKSDTAFYGEDEMYEYDFNSEDAYNQIIQSDQRLKRAKIKVGPENSYRPDSTLNIVYNTKNFGVMAKDEFALLASSLPGQLLLTAKNIGFTMTSGMKVKSRESFAKLTVGFMFFFLAVFAGCTVLSAALAQITTKTYRVEGRVVEIKQVIHKTSGGRSGRTIPSEILVDIPIYEYVLNGKTYTFESDIARNIGTPHIGEIVEIFINSKGEPIEKTDMALMAVLGFCFLAFGSLLVILMLTGVIKVN